MATKDAQIKYLKAQLKWLKENRNDSLSNQAKNQIENELHDLAFGGEF